MPNNNNKKDKTIGGQLLSREQWFRVKKWLLFCYSLATLKAIIVLQILSLTQVKQSELNEILLTSHHKKELVIKPKDVWPILTLTPLYLLFYNLTLLATYHHYYHFSILLCHAMAALTFISIAVAIQVTPLYWFCVQINAFHTFLQFLFIMDLRDVNNHVFQVKHVTEHFVNNVHNYVQRGGSGGGGGGEAVKGGKGVAMDSKNVIGLGMGLGLMSARDFSAAKYAS